MVVSQAERVAGSWAVVRPGKALDGVTRGTSVLRWFETWPRYKYKHFSPAT
jgi:hypothetical protein